MATCSQWYYHSAFKPLETPGSTVCDLQLCLSCFLVESEVHVPSQQEVGSARKVGAKKNEAGDVSCNNARPCKRPRRDDAGRFTMPTHTFAQHFVVLHLSPRQLPMVC